MQTCKDSQLLACETILAPGECVQVAVGRKQLFVILLQTQPARALEDNSDHGCGAIGWQV